jgi:hypothetical protein
MLVVASLITSLLCRLVGRVVSTVRAMRQESRRAGQSAAGERFNRHGIQKVRAESSLNFNSVYEN